MDSKGRVSSLESFHKTAAKPELQDSREISVIPPSFFYELKNKQNFNLLGAVFNTQRKTKAEGVTVSAKHGEEPALIYRKWA